MTQLQKARASVKKSLTGSIIKSILVGVILTVGATALCFYVSPTSLFIPLLLQGEYLAAFIQMSLYALGFTLLDIAVKWSDINQAFKLLRQTKGK